ncbi:MAG: hypothetical protein DRJ98_07930 [Thermoprotei archaeon]|nr:MAG: hypothetical protein DRJ98_07930 [Thermoprotei archaeon]
MEALWLQTRRSKLEVCLDILQALARTVEPAKPIVVEAKRPPSSQGPSSVLRFKSWEEFKEVASRCEGVSYVIRWERGAGT